MKYKWRDLRLKRLRVNSLTLIPGGIPLFPENGEMWSTTQGVFVRVNGATVGPLLGTEANPPSFFTEEQENAWGDGSVCFGGSAWDFLQGDWQ